jgi:NADH-quinone oxidoreductase subunit D
MYTWREREKVLDLFESLSGNRVMHGCNRIGGVKWNVAEEQVKSAVGALTYLDTVADKITKAVIKDSNIAERCKGVGSLSKEDAIRLGAVGPNARASGLPLKVETLLLRHSCVFQSLNNPFGSPRSFSLIYRMDQSKPSTTTT